MRAVVIILLFRELWATPANSTNEDGSCSREGYGAGLKSLWIESGGSSRRFMLFMPDVSSEELLPLWILGPGTGEGPEDLLAETDMVPFARRHRFAFVALLGNDDALNVAGNVQPLPSHADDVSYAKAVLQAITTKHCIDLQRIHCAGYSRGGRFCMLLASEFSGLIASVAPVSSLRFPKPNRAMRAIPLLAFHGTGDPVNPFNGNGDPRYWHEPVLEAQKRWAIFNGCTDEPSWVTRSATVKVASYRGCQDAADVDLVVLDGAGHTWPGSSYAYDEKLGTVNREIQANDFIWEFFDQHRLRRELPQPTEKLSFQALLDPSSSEMEDEGFFVRQSQAGLYLEQGSRLPVEPTIPPPVAPLLEPELLPPDDWILEPVDTAKDEGPVELTELTTEDDRGPVKQKELTMAVDQVLPPSAKHSQPESWDIRQLAIGALAGALLVLALLTFDACRKRNQIPYLYKEESRDILCSPVKLRTGNTLDDSSPGRSREMTMSPASFAGRLRGSTLPANWFTRMSRGTSSPGFLRGSGSPGIKGGVAQTWQEEP